MAKKQQEKEVIDNLNVVVESNDSSQEEVVDITDYTNPFTPNSTYADWMDKNNLEDLDSAIEFTESLDCITDEQKEHIKNELKLIIK